MPVTCLSSLYKPYEVGSVAYPKLREEQSHQIVAKKLVKKSLKVLKAMESNTKLVVITLVLALTLTAASGQSICGISYAGLYACKPYVQTKNPLTTPIDPLGPCCSALSKADFQCLCKQKTKGNPFVSGIDFDLASKLPEKCGLLAPTC